MGYWFTVTLYVLQSDMFLIRFHGGLDVKHGQTGETSIHTVLDSKYGHNSSHCYALFVVWLTISILGGTLYVFCKVNFVFLGMFVVK